MGLLGDLRCHSDLKKGHRCNARHQVLGGLAEEEMTAIYALGWRHKLTPEGLGRQTRYFAGCIVKQVLYQPYFYFETESY